MAFDLEDAITIALKAHTRQKDWAGWPYITHPLRLMSKVDTEQLKILAVLHDVVEDSTVTEDDLRKAGMSEDLLAVLKLLTRVDSKDSSNYEAYIESIRRNPLARKVKLADLEDNMSLTRMPREITEKDVPRLALYFRSWVILKKEEDSTFSEKVR